MNPIVARLGRIASRVFGILLGVASVAHAQDQSTTIRAARVIDGKGQVLQNATVEIKGATILKVDHRNGPVTSSR